MNEIKEVLTATEVNTLSNLAKEIWFEYFPGIITEDQVEYMTDLFLSPGAIINGMNEGQRYFFLTEDLKPIGFFVIKPEETRMFLSKLYLDQEHRNKGLASLMFDEIVKLTGEEGLDKIYLTVNKNNLHPIDVYKHYGFEVIDSVVNDIGEGYVMDDYILEKNLD